MSNLLIGAAKSLYNFTTGRLAGFFDHNGNENRLPIYDAANTGLEVQDASKVFLAVNQTTGAASLRGSATNDNAAAGFQGELVSSAVAVGAEVALATNTVANVTSISLSAGDWDVSGVVDFDLTGATATGWAYGVSTTSASLGGQDTYGSDPLALTTSTGQYAKPTPTVRLSLAAATTVYLVAKSTFSAGTVAAFGTLRARRVR